MYILNFGKFYEYTSNYHALFTVPIQSNIFYVNCPLDNCQNSNKIFLHISKFNILIPSHYYFIFKIFVINLATFSKRLRFYLIGVLVRIRFGPCQILSAQRTVIALEIVRALADDVLTHAPNGVLAARMHFAPLCCTKPVVPVQTATQAVLRYHADQIRNAEKLLRFYQQFRAKQTATVLRIRLVIEDQLNAGTPVNWALLFVRITKNVKCGQGDQYVFAALDSSSTNRESWHVPRKMRNVQPTTNVLLIQLALRVNAAILALHHIKIILYVHLTKHVTSSITNQYVCALRGAVLLYQFVSEMLAAHQAQLAKTLNAKTLAME